VAAHTLLTEPKFSNLHEYPNYSDVVDNIVDAHNQEFTEVQSPEESPNPHDYLKTTSVNGEKWIRSSVTVHVQKVVPA
jgi:hypothetical protein